MSQANQSESRGQTKKNAKKVWLYTIPAKTEGGGSSAIESSYFRRCGGPAVLLQHGEDVLEEVEL
jgi:hypothetical protein